MTEAGKKIIELLKSKESFSLQGNREFWEILKYESGKFICVEGETFGNQETGRTEISDIQALKKIKKYFQSHSEIWENKSISTDEEILEYWKRWKHEGA